MVSWDILLDILIMLGAALAFGTLAEQMRQSAILGYLVAGTLVGPNVFAFVDQGEHVRAIAELGVALLLFTIGLEFSFPRLRRLGRVALLGGTLQVVFTFAAGAAICTAFGLDIRAALAVGAMTALSSTACVLRLLVERNAIDSMYGRNALGILLLQDIAVIPLMLLVVILAGGTTPMHAAMLLGKTMLLAALLVGGFLILFNFIVPRLLNIDRWSRNRELPVLLAIVIALGSAYAAHAASLSAAMGAFVAGVLLGESPFAAQIRADVGSLRTLLVTIFFASIGMLGDPVWVAAHWHLVAGAVVLIVVGKAALAATAVRMLGAPVGVAAATGLSVAQVGEFSFVLAEMARAPIAIISLDLFNLIVSATILTLFITPFLVMAAPRVAALVVRWQPFSADQRRSVQSRDSETSAMSSIVIIGFGPSGQAVAHDLSSKHRDEISVVEVSRRVGAAAKRMGLRLQTGDATHHDVLEHARVRGAQVIIVTVADPTVTRAIIHACRNAAPDAAVIARARYHTSSWELVLAGARDVVDEEEHVGLRMAAIAHQYLYDGEGEE